MFIGAKLDAVYTASQLTGSESGSVPAPGDVFFDRGGKIYKRSEEHTSELQSHTVW